MFNSPMRPERADDLIDLLAAAPGSRVIDLGCGDGRFLLRMAARQAILGTGIDHAEDLIEEANRNAPAQPSARPLTFVCADAAGYWDGLEASSVDVMVCIGGEFILGGCRALLQRAKAKLSSQGRILLGTVYWKQPPPADYLALMNGENPHFDLLTTVTLAREEGYLPLAVFRSSDDEWDAFESYHAQKRYQAALQSNQPALIERAWRWQQGYLQWGMNTMGFCFRHYSQ
ncbi:MAG: class I SAM-dependent methyltransferase [Anaerolineae bacterium]|nr:class I SAM-dependent methyltransferase [Anaerolineae bacterium]